ncbi:U3 small nucleolar RNA-associated protein 4 homolog [Aricia agestis]|uniref:U3 small nucleolar RNA-associated protein 4 homolog n=1 Tax=Aricia agestis TaxID=91739 RepID=UPI001C2041DA|nr:U3 small nucleolar RNA-associated protein 4 homolog [Aricia agestis]
MACKIHRVRYYNPKPESIHCVAFNKTSKLLALARGNATIEIWDMNYAPFLLKFIPGTENTSVEGLGWVHDRLLSTGLSGALIEWDLDTLAIKTNVVLTGYAAWCLDVNSDNTLVAVGTEQGYLNLYSVENDEIVYKKIFDKQEGRIMCCKFNKNGNVLATGSIDTIRVWNVETGHATCRMSVSRKGRENIVWTLAMLADNVLVSGDSFGRLTFWDGQLGEQIESYTTHRADILSLVVSEDENSLYCSGVDPVIVNFIKVNNSSGKQSTAQWVKNIQRNIHEHDVRSLILNGNKLISLGSDGYLTQSSYPPKWVMRLPPMIPGPRTFVAAENKLLLLRYSNHIEVWKLGSYATDKSGEAKIAKTHTKHLSKSKEDSNNLEEDCQTMFNGDKQSNKQNLTITENPIKLVSIQSKKKKQILCCAMSPSGEMVVYSTDSDMRILKLDCDDEQNISVSKVLVSGISRCDRAVFAADSRALAAHWAGQVCILHVDPTAAAAVVQSIDTEKHLKSNSLIHLTLSERTNSGAIYLAAAGMKGDVAVWIQRPDSKKFEYHATLPKYRCVPSAMMVHPDKETLVAVHVDQKIIEYDLFNKVVTKWPGGSLPAAWTSRAVAASSLAPHPQRDAILVTDDTSLWVLDRTAKNDYDRDGPEEKKKRQKGSAGNMGLNIVPVKYLAGFHWLGEDEAVIVEVLPEHIVSQLPPVLAIKKHNRDKL